MAGNVKPRASRLEPLRPNDAFFLNAESGGAHQHIVGVAVLDVSRRPGGPLDLADLGARLAPHLDAGELPRLRQRLAATRGGIARPVWVSDPAFSIGRHLRSSAISLPGGRRELEAAVEAILVEPLPRDRPLWELWLLDGLAGARQAVVIKMHHAIADGVGALHLVERLLDDDGHRRPIAGAGNQGEPRRAGSPPAAVVFAGAVAHQITAPVADLYASVQRAVREPSRTLKRARQTLEGVWELARAGRADPTALNGPLGPSRRVALVEVSRATVRSARRHDGGTDNDVVLAAVLAALDEWFAKNGGPVPTHLRTVVPVSTRRRHGDEPGNWTATLDVDLPVAAASPRERLRGVVAATNRAKRSNQRLGSQFVMSAVGMWAPAPLHAAFTRFAYRGAWLNLIVSNVPGVRRPRSLAGAPVEAAYPVIPLVQGVGFAVAAMTWGDKLTFGFVADASRVPDVDGVASAAVAFVEGLAGRPVNAAQA